MAPTPTALEPSIGEGEGEDDGVKMRRVSSDSWGMEDVGDVEGGTLAVVQAERGVCHQGRGPNGELSSIHVHDSGGLEGGGGGGGGGGHPLDGYDADDAVNRLRRVSRTFRDGVHAPAAWLQTFSYTYDERFPEAEKEDAFQARWRDENRAAVGSLSKARLRFDTVNVFAFLLFYQLNSWHTRRGTLMRL